MKKTRRNRRLERGAVVYLSTDRHPFVVVSNNSANRHSSEIIVIPMSSKHKRLDLRTHAIVNFHDSLILAENIRSVKKDTVKSIVHILNRESMEKVDSCLHAALNLD